jgi:2-phosphosulfolactate phosphatase
MQIHFATLDDCHTATGTVVVIDVLLAFTTEAFAFAEGATSIVLASTVEEALELKARFEGSLAMGEVGTLPIPEFDMSNSSAALLDKDVAGRRIIHRTSNGTQGVVRSRNAKSMFVTGFPTASATAAHVLAERPDDVTFVITGITDDREGDEDRACAEFIADLLRNTAPDKDHYIERAYKSGAGQWFTDPEKPEYLLEDLELATDIDRFDFAMPVAREDGLLITRPVKTKVPA